jgi:hypothetical protein
MALDKFIPLSPDPDLNAGSDMTLAKFGHLNTIVDYLNAYVAVDSLQLAGSGPITATARYISDSTGINSAISISTIGVGIGTDAPVGILDLFKSAAATRLAIRGDAGQNRLISYRTGAVQRFGLYVNNTAESGSNAGSDFAIRAYNDAGTLLNTPVFIKRSTGNVGINTLTGTAKLQVVGSGSTSATTSLLVQNSAGTVLLKQSDDGNLQLYTGTFSPYAYTSSGGFTIYAASNFSIALNGGINSTVLSAYYYTGDIYAKYAVAIGNIGIATINASAQLQVDSTTKGFLPPRMTTAQKNLIATPATGLQVHDTDLNRPCFYNGTSWVTL